MSFTVQSKQLVKVTTSEVYYAFTNATALTEWMCDYATVAPHPGGRMYLWWHGDFYSAGEYVALEKDRSVTFKWQGRFDPAPSEILVDLQAKKDGTLVTMSHTVPDGEDWKERAHNFKEEWNATLANLAQVLETGIDKRTYDRPMLGININDFNAQIAKSMGVPVDQGIRLDSLIEEMGAYKAGLRPDDVIVQLEGKPITNDFGSLVIALQGKKGGDRVEVVYYRGPQRKTTSMELSKRPIPKIPWDPDELSKLLRMKYDQALAQLDDVFTGVSESQAELRPSPNEWNAKETLAHLIQNERHWLEHLDDVIAGYARVSDDWGGNSTIHVRATAAAFHTVRAMLDELAHLADEMVAYTAELPESFMTRKASYFQMVNTLLEGSLPHIPAHLEQIKAAIRTKGS